MIPANKNWSQITGQVMRVREAQDLPGYTELEVRIDAAEPVAGYAHMLGWSQDQPLAVQVPTERVEALGLEPGSRLSGSVRVAAPGRNFADPDSLAKH